MKEQGEVNRRRVIAAGMATVVLSPAALAAPKADARVGFPGFVIE
jgi:hypothetical protein